jgi:C4-dicarboxylate transporter DctQ subunit
MNPMTFLEKLERIFDRVLGIFVAIACVMFSLVTLSVCLDVVLRYFFNHSQVWVLELSEYSLLYITFLVIAWVLKSGGHVTVDLLTTLLSPKGRSICSAISFLVCFMVAIVLTVYGSRVTWDHFSKGIYNPTILEIPKGAIILIIPIGGITLLIQSIRGMLMNLRSLREKPDRIDSVQRQSASPN